MQREESNLGANQFTRILADFRDGREGAEARLIELVYSDLRRLARKQLHGRRMGTLNTTSLISESYFRLVSPAARHVESRDHFYFLASRVLRQVIVDYARSRIRESQKIDRGTEIDTALDSYTDDLVDAQQLVRIDEALTDLARENERQARVVECRFFAGMTEEETAQALGASLRTVQREWDRAKEWLHDHLKE